MVDAEDKKETRLFSGRIRTLSDGDIPSLRPILATWVKDRTTGQPLPEEVEEDLQVMQESIGGNNGRTYFVAEDLDGSVIGVIGFKIPDPRMLPFTESLKPAELVNAYVSQDRRAGKGVGRALVSKLEEEAKTKGFTEIVLNSGPRYKDTGWGFYDKLEGYQRVGIAKGYYGEGGDAPVWRKTL